MEKIRNKLTFCLKVISCILLIASWTYFLSPEENKLFHSNKKKIIKTRKVKRVKEIEKKIVVSKITNKKKKPTIIKEVSNDFPKPVILKPKTTNTKEIKIKEGVKENKNEITVKKDIPVRLHFTAENAGCGRQLVISGLDVRALSQNGEEAIVEFTPTKEGSYQYSCGMRMFPPGNFVVTV